MAVQKCQHLNSIISLHKICSKTIHLNRVTQAYLCFMTEVAMFNDNDTQ